MGIQKEKKSPQSRNSPSGTASKTGRQDDHLPRVEQHHPVPLFTFIHNIQETKHQQTELFRIELSQPIIIILYFYSLSSFM